MARVLAALIVAAVGAVGTAVRAQGLPSEPLSVGDGRLVLGAEITATAAAADPGFFNYTDYEYSALRNVRLGVAAELRASQRLKVLGEIRLDHGDRLQPFALYARIRPWLSRRLDIQVGRVPPTFGAFGRSSYGTANMLVGVPLAYQYLTSLRPDAIPAGPADLIRMRARGWLSSFPVGNPAPDRGLPLVNTFRWDTGVQVHGVDGVVEWTAALTTGSLSNPRVDDDNGGRQLAGRAVVRPAPPIALGVSLARGAFLSRALDGALAPGRSADDGVQQAVGVDAEFSTGRFLTRGEIIWSAWTVPATRGGTDDLDLRAAAMLAEARYRLLPGLHVAGRVERLGFSHLETATTRARWEAPVRRVELGAGYSVLRNVMVKGAWQRNRRDGGRVRRDTIGALQIVYWF